MISNAEYNELKLRELEDAVAFVERIKNNPDPRVKYRDPRPITDLKHMIETSVQQFADRPAFWQKPSHNQPYTPITYSEAMADINGLGTSLVAGGLSGKCIAVVGVNSYEWAISYLAVVCGTGIIVPIDKELSKTEVTTIMKTAEVAAVIYDDKHQKMMRDIKDEGETPLTTLVSMSAKESQGDILSLRELIEAGKHLVAKGEACFTKAQIDRNAMSVLLFTSGTTGKSKGVMLSHANIVADLMVAPTVLKVNPTDVFFSFLPLHHTYECTCGFLMPLYKGASIAYCEGLRFIVKNLSESRPTMFLGVPAIFENMYKKIWQGAQKKGKAEALRKAVRINRALKKVHIDLSKILFKDVHALFGGRMRLIISGGAAINPEVLEGIQDFGIMAVQGYGLTEAAPMGALNPDTAAVASSIGTPFPNCEVRIDNPNEEGIGEICLKGDNIMLGYFGMPEETAKVIKDGWFYTGDLGYMDDKRYIYITGRQKNVIITKNGKNVYPEELEYLIALKGLTSESMVWERTSEGGGNDGSQIVASLVPEKEVLEEKLGVDYSQEAAQELLWKAVEEINQELPYYKKIKNIIVRTEPLVKNTSNKIVRFAEENKR